MSRARHDLEALLESVYVKCNPAKLLSTPGFVKTVLDKYDGYHDCLVMKLRLKYENVAPYELQKLDDFVTSNQKNGTYFFFNDSPSKTKRYIHTCRIDRTTKQQRMGVKSQSAQDSRRKDATVESDLRKV